MLPSLKHPAVPLATAIALLLSVAGTSVSAAETIRIEPKRFYGATVTVEAGVRVFRPLPADSRVIINPGGRTPLYLELEDRRSTSTHTYQHQHPRH